MTRVKVVAYTPQDPETGPHEPGEYVELRDATADIWVQRGWAIRLPKVEEKPVMPERAVIETPEDSSRAANRETATVGAKRKKK